jgi:predicted alpha/beta superfamily hydrolase
MQIHQSLSHASPTFIGQFLGISGSINTDSDFHLKDTEQQELNNPNPDERTKENSGNDHRTEKMKHTNDGIQNTLKKENKLLKTNAKLEKRKELPVKILK